MNMKIVLLIDTLGYGGGAERQFAGLALSLHERGFNVKVLAYHPDEDGYQNEFEQAGVEYLILPHNGSQLSKFKAVRSQIAKEHPDIVISYKDSPNIMACLLKTLGAKWRLIVSDRNTLQGINKTTKVQYNILYRFADYIVPNSYAQKDFIDSHFHHLSHKVQVITNFTDTATFTPRTVTLNQTEVRKRTVLTVARIAKQKNTLAYIEAANILAPKWRDKVHLVWYGTANVSEDNYALDCKNKITEYGLDGFFEFKEPVTNIADVYREADIFCLPSKWEGFPNALCEAMASGLAACASDICDNSRIISDGQNGLIFNSDSPADIAAKLDILLSMHPEQFAQFSAKAREYTLTNLSRDAFTEKYLKIICK